MNGRRGEPLNLARHPFVNERPVHRTVVLLWIAGLALLAVDLWLYWGYVTGFGHRRSELATVEGRIEQEEQAMAVAADRLAGLDLAGRNKQADFLNAKIDERTFPWSGLFDDVAAVLPRQVRLLSMTPLHRGDRAAAASSRPERAKDPGRVQLQVRGIAETEDALLELLDRLFASSHFAQPNLARETRDQQRGINFSLTVDYYPVRPAAPAVELGEDAPVGRALRQRLGEVVSSAVKVETIAEQPEGTAEADAGEVRVRLTGTAATRDAVDELVAQVGGDAAFGAPRIAHVEPAPTAVEKSPAGSPSAVGSIAGTTAGQPVRFDVDVVFRPAVAATSPARPPGPVPSPTRPSASGSLVIR